jgi:hypothetical protein
VVAKSVMDARRFAMCCRVSGITIELLACCLFRETGKLGLTANSLLNPKSQLDVACLAHEERTTGG